MNLKKNLVKIIAIILFTIITIPQLNVKTYAAKTNQEMWLGVVPLMGDKLKSESDEQQLGYSINDVLHGGQKIWNIVQYPSQNEDTYSEVNFYCIKAGLGFTQSDSGGFQKKQKYDKSLNMITEREDVKNQNEVLRQLIEHEINDENGNYNRYNALLALLDRLYITPEGGNISDEENQKYEKEKQKLVNKILLLAQQDPTSGSKPDLMRIYSLTTSDITAVQQAAIWYFTNYYEQDGENPLTELESHNMVYDKTDSISWVWYTTNGEQYNIFSGYNPDNIGDEQATRGQARTYQMEYLYNYLINEAIKNADEYENLNEAETPIRVDTTTLTTQTIGQKTVIGPIHVTKVNARPFSIDLTVNNNGSKVENYKLLDNPQAQDRDALNIEDIENIEEEKSFYISIPTTQVSNLSVDVGINYDSRNMNVWVSSENANAQPLVELDKEDKSTTVKLTQNPEKNFDLALRKYITKVNDEPLTGSDLRTPKTTITDVTTGASVQYKHKKDPVIIEAGNTITYEIAIYNEGQKPGYARKVIDQLPTGLEFVEVVNGNYEEDNYNEETNTLTLRRKAQTENTEILQPYESGTLDSEIIEIKCKVTAVPDTEKSKVLTNVAWISEAYDKEADKTITSEKGADIDSEPATKPNVSKDTMSDYTGDEENKNQLTDSEYYYKGQQDDDDFEKVVILPEAFDLKLLKFITAVNGEEVPNRINGIDVSKLNTLDDNGNIITTGDYDLNKEAVAVKKGDIITYTFRVYNEGTIDGYAEEITEDVPEGLEFLWSDKEDQELEQDTTFTAAEKEAIESNQKYLWGFETSDIDANGKITMIRTKYLSKANETELGDNLIKAFGRNDGTKNEQNLSYKEITVKFKVISDAISGTTIRNEAAITEDADSEGKTVNDRDSSTEEWPGRLPEHNYQDDEDYDNVVLKSFDLAARKFITAVSKDNKIENDEYLKNADGSYTRAPMVDTSKLNTLDETGKMITTATYNHSKEPVEVEPNDFVVYMIRVYNEGDIDGYAGEITDHLPSNLEFVDGTFNSQYGWEVSQDGRTVTTKYLNNTKINKAQVNTTGEIVLSYVEVPIMCKVNGEMNADEKLTNIADITEYLDEDKKPIEDRDSKQDNVVLPEDEDLPGYKDNEQGTYIPGQEDDDDFEKVVIKPFDLALRKFITQIEENVVDTRIPQVKYDAENDKITYEHDKNPLTVVSGNTVTYTIRVFNEGARNGYAAQILDDIPDGLEYLPENVTNMEYRWKMYRILADGEEVGTRQTIVQDGVTYVETENSQEADVIVTDYLSKEQGEERISENSELKENPNLLKAFNKEAGVTATNPDYKDVKVAFKVVELNASDKVIVNAAQISKDTDENGKDVEDRDSTPGEWNDGEDDQDKEYVELKEFDLALRKWVTQAIVTENGKQTVTQTGHNPYDDPEQVVKLEIKQNMLNKVTVKFKYSIRVINEGDIAGYAKEVTDYVPQGLKFVASDNPGWTDEGNNVISTRLLENTLLQPGEYADVEVILTWINSESGLGTVLENVAEISEDYNDYNAPDKDSTPDNKKDGEDDIDDAPVILSIKTGQVRIYFTLGFIVLITIAAGVVLIKKYVI